ncbi:spatacsin carboxy-terminus protein [Perilla frutescens var. hirtella]|uniref:Spatacsin carboxy-terminus protein n=1 Tax=Perilla frutescens var. hirtella TaxID=608512 RepID=A0AAD4JHU9_PERFH|nr:spatacsin carboxy-terminus protein [Perilla frutescens var. hirtella]
MDVDSCPIEDGLPVLQLRKWGPSEFPYNPSGFREGFISPVRNLLLLLSYDSEALLYPLVKGRCITNKNSEITSDEMVADPHESSKPSISCSRESISGSSDSVALDGKSGYTSGVSFRESTGAFISEVDSVAWGLCGDTCDPHKEASFQELLFVSGKQGVFVHVFSKFDESCEVIKPEQTSDVGQGKWVEWGPAATLSPTFEVQEVLESHHKATGERSNTYAEATAEDEQSASPKKWMHTFLTKAERVTSGSYIYTRLPERSLFPNNGVVSFRIFDQDSQFLDLQGSTASCDKTNPSMPVMGRMVNKPDMDLNSSITTLVDDSASSSGSGAMSGSYKCVKVFSNNSHRLVGFALVSISSTPVNTSYLNDGNYVKVLVSVARTVSWGIQWLYSAKLNEKLDAGPFEWIDFTFSDRFLICLSTSGTISLYGAMTGEYIASLNVLRMNEPGYSSSTRHQIGSLAIKGKFKRLFVFPHSLLLGVMAESGIIYVIPTDNLALEDKFSFEDVLPYQYYSDLGLLTGWQVGGAEIGYQRVLSNSSQARGISRLAGHCRNSCFNGSLPSKENLKTEHSHIKDSRSGNGSYLATFSTATQILSEKKSMFSDFSSCLIRKAFIPPSGCSGDDVICCSHFGVTRLIKRYSYEKKLYQVTHANLQLDFVVNDDINYSMPAGETSSKDAVGCNFSGLLYLVTNKGLSVVLPSISVPQNFYPVEAIGYCLLNCSSSIKYGAGDLMGVGGTKKPMSPWKVEVLDRVLLYEGPEVAEKLCLENGWELGISRIRHLQLALDYLEFDAIENSLEMLMRVDMAVEGILRLLFAAVYLMFNKVSNDNEVSAASRLLALATSYATRVIRKYGLLHHKKVVEKPLEVSGNDGTYPLLELTEKEHDEEGTSRSLTETARFLVVIRSLQQQLNEKFRRPGQLLTVNAGLPNTVSNGLSEDEFKFPAVSEDALLLSISDQRGTAHLASGTELNNAENLALMPVDTVGAETPDVQNFDKAVLVSEGSAFGKRTSRVENPKDMIARWELDNMDLKTVVKDALLSGRLPLAVLRLHLHHQNNLLPGTETHDTFNDVRIAGRAIAYDLFVKGEIGLGITTLQKLGEDVETTLKQLVFGTVRRSLRVLVAEEMKRYTYLGPHELKILEMLSLIERVYPCNSFFSTLATRRKELKRASNENPPGEISLHLLHPLFKDLIISCGEIDGVVLGSWTTIDEHSVAAELDDDTSHAAYWATAAAWSDVWDQRVVDRILLDQPLLMGVNVLWESQLEYHACHNDWLEVSKLLEVVPPYALSPGSLSISLDDIHPASSIEYGQELPGYSYSGFLEDLDTVCMNVPNIRLFRFSTNRTCSAWLRRQMEHQLAKKFIFLVDYWNSVSDIVHLLAQSGFMIDLHDNSFLDGTNDSSSDTLLVIGDASIDPNAVQSLHKVVVRFCAQYNLLNLLDIYLDVHKLAIDHDSLSFLLDAAGDNEWAKCLLLVRVKGKEYDVSFSNARAVAARNLVPGNKLTVLETDDIIQAVDDIAEGAGEMAALATLMFAPAPLQECLSSGSVNRHCSSAQCTLENLRPALHRFPTLWNTLVAACFGQDPVCCNLSLKTKMSGYSELLDYLNWREGVFFSSIRDTSILQMIPFWFPKAVRRLIQLYVQGPIGWQSLADSETEELSLLRDIYYVVNSSGHAQISATSWEAAIQRHIEEELYASSIEGAEVGLEHHLHRGRALAALNHLVSARVHNLKSDNNKHRGQSESPSTGQTNVQSDVQTLLAPITESEESLLSSVIPLAIEHFDDSVLVASCAFLLELCGFSASTLRIDIAALRRISSFYKSAENSQYRQLSPRGTAFLQPPVEVDVTESLARTLADDYLHKCSSSIMRKGDRNNSVSNQPSRALLVVLQNLEKASLPFPSNGMTCGSWLSSGNGDGADLRSQQKATSQHWQLVTAFCQMHNIPLSTKYLAVLARDNDWVGFLSEVQVGKYPFETVIQVASKEFSDPRLKTHISTVLRNMQSRKKAGPLNIDTGERDINFLLNENLCMPVELFGIIAECERREKPGEALLLKAKNLCWSILAMIASCFPDVSPMSCLTVWLEITAARETSAIKVNDIASQIARNVGAAVEVTNSLPASARAITFRYNRKNSKRRRLQEPVPVDTLTSADSLSSKSSTVSNTQGFLHEEEREKIGDEDSKFLTDSNRMANALSRMVAVLCEQHLFLPLLQAFEIFLPSCSLLPFIRALQAFSQMRLSEASAHLGLFSTRIKEESPLTLPNWEREGKIGNSWTRSIAVKAADAMLLTCPSPYEKRCLLRLLAATDFGDGGSIASRYGQLSWKIDRAEPSLRSDECPLLGNETFDDASLLTALEKNGYWEQARSWAKKLEASGESCWKSAASHVTEMQAEAMVAEWREFLWDIPEERVALWSHCQTLFIRYSFPALQAGQFFLKHAEAAEKDISTRELHDILLLALQWLSGMTTLSNPVYPPHLLREIETRVWLLAVESEALVKNEGEDSSTYPTRESGAGKGSDLMDRTASIIAKMDNHINGLRLKSSEKNDRENGQTHVRMTQTVDSSFSSTAGGGLKTKRRAKGSGSSRKSFFDAGDKKLESESIPLNPRDETQFLDENLKIDASLSRWEERVGPAELERAVLSLLEFGQITAARQLQNKLAPDNMPSEFFLVDAALKLAALSTPSNKVSMSMLDNDVLSVILSYNLLAEQRVIDPLQVLESLASLLKEGSGRGLCRRIISVVKAANVLGLTFSEAFEKQPIELLQLLSLKAQESFEEAHLLVQTHSMPAASIAQILAESFLKGLLAAHRGGYMESQKEEGPAPLLWRISDFLKWAELCPSDSEIGHALMRLVITGQEIPHACEVELLILSHHFYKLSACLDGVDVLVALAATRVEAYVSEGDFSCLARLITGVGNFHALNFILGILIENGQLDLLLQKYSAAADANSGTAEAVRGFRMAVLTSLKQFNPSDLDAFAMVYSHFDMKHETAALLESRAKLSSQQWFHRYDRDQNEELLESMRYFIEAAEVHSSIDAGNKTRKACAQASLVSLQIRMPDTKWLDLSETNARRILVEQSRFQEALIVAEAYGLNQPSEWALVLWEQMLNPELTEQFVAEFVAVLPLQPSMLAELARFYRSEMQARGDQSQFSVWLTGGGLPADWAKYIGRSYRCLLKRTRDIRFKHHLATSATGFDDVVEACNRELDKVPENAGPLILRKGHGGAYLPLM